MPEQNTPPLDKYLREKMILKIADYEGYDLFELSSGSFANEFISIWDIFDDKEYLDKVINSLSSTDEFAIPNLTFCSLIININFHSQLFCWSLLHEISGLI